MRVRRFQELGATGGAGVGEWHIIEGAMPNTEPNPSSSTATATLTETKTKKLPPWNVVLLNDEDHTFEFVIRMMQELFSHGKQKAEIMAKTVDKDGRVICLTTHKEHAELKADQVHAFGRDKLVAACKGPMSAIIEPAEFGGDEDEGKK